MLNNFQNTKLETCKIQRLHTCHSNRKFLKVQNCQSRQFFIKIFLESYIWIKIEHVYPILLKSRLLCDQEIFNFCSFYVEWPIHRSIQRLTHPWCISFHLLSSHSLSIIHVQKREQFIHNQEFLFKLALQHIMK